MIRTLATCLLLMSCASLAEDAASDALESLHASRDVELQTDPGSPFWRAARPVYAEVDNYGKPMPHARTEVRSRWTQENLYLLFTCPYEELYVNPKPVTSAETNELWKWDVAELFVSADFENIRRYREFEVSPQGEWVDLDINLDLPDHTVGWTWNSGFQVSARIDSRKNIWYGAMRIPFSALDGKPPYAGRAYRANLFRTEGRPSAQKAIAWKAPMSETFHTPERFGSLKLVGTK